MADRDGGSCPHLPTDLFGRFREGVKRVHTILLFSAWERSSRMETARSAEPVAAVGNGADSPRREAWSFRRRHPAYPPTGRPHGRPHGRFMPLLGGHPHVALLVIRLPTHRPGANAEAAYRGRHPYGCQPEPCRKASFRFRGLAPPDRHGYPSRLVHTGEGAHGDTEKDMLARDVGIDGGAASAEEAAVHRIPDGNDGLP